MSTFVNYLVNSIEDQWKEVDVLIEKSAEERDTNPTLYSALCRASIVLMVAHLEGFTKEVARAILDDVNQFSSFKNTPYPIQSTFCKMFVEEDGRRTKKLIDLLCVLETKLSLEPFLIESARGNNKNPSPRVIDKICANFGVNNFFSRIENSQLDDIFSSVRSGTEALLEELINHTSVGTEVYPYSMNVSEFGIDASDAKKKPINTQWMEFLDYLLESRNRIAHGSSTTNSLSVEELIDFRDKVAVLQHALVLVLCHEALPKDARAC
ncbi:MAG: MAE_28990/MAE_18760 family HEPN-like nuclease [Phormidesmis sp.]